jgi:hypothetical protein
MNIAEKLFSSIEQNEEKRKNSDYQVLKKKYEARVMLPNSYGLFSPGEDSTKAVSSYPFNPDKVLYTKDDVDVLMKLVENKYDTDNEYDIDSRIEEIINDLVEILYQKHVKIICQTKKQRFKKNLMHF